MKLNIKLLHLLVSALFFSLLMVFWGVFYPEHLIQKEQMQLFLLGGEYLWDHLTYQGGFAIYAGEFLTQFFIFPWVGAIVLSGLALSLYLSVRKILNILWGNRIYMLALVPALSYTFLLFNDFYYVSGILALCVSGWLIVAYIKISNPKIRILVGIVFFMLLYWLFGGAYLVFAASIVLIEILIRVFNDLSLLGIKNIGLILVGYLLLVVIMPLFARYFLVTDTFLQSYFSTAYYKFRLVFPTSILFIFLSFPIIVLYYGMIHRLLSDRIVRFLQYVCVLLLLVYGGYGFYQFSDFEMEREMKYDNMVVNQQWEEIIATAAY